MTFIGRIHISRTKKLIFLPLLHAAFATVHLQLLPLQLLLGDFLLLGLCGSSGWDLGEGLLLLEKHDLDVAGQGHARVDMTVSSVCASTHLGSAVHLQ